MDASSTQDLSQSLSFTIRSITCVKSHNVPMRKNTHYDIGENTKRILRLSYFIYRSMENKLDEQRRKQILFMLVNLLAIPSLMHYLVFWRWAKWFIIWSAETWNHCGLYLMSLGARAYLLSYEGRNLKA